MKSKKLLREVLNKAMQMLQTGNKSRAIELLSNHCNTQIDNPQIRREIGIFLQQNKMPVKAEAFYLDSLRIDNNQAIIYFNLGIIYQNSNRTNQAIKYYLQATKISPDYARAYANLGYLYKQIDDLKRSQKACLTAQQLDPNDPQIKHMIAALGIEKAPDAAEQNYIQNLYDDYASKYDEHLSVTLKSKIPELIYTTTSTLLNNTANNKIKNISMLDLGCGTGICGALFNKITDKMTGVDLSTNMLSEAKKKNIYNSLIPSDIAEYLEKNTEKYDIVISSDVLIYFGSLHRIFSGVNRTLKKEGLFSFSIESLYKSPTDYSLNDSGRYKHSHHYITQQAKKHNFLILSSNETTLRQQNKENVIGRIYALKKP